MINMNNLNKNFWDAIRLHYEKECYEDTLKDACLYIIELLQEKSENYDMDGEKLINNVFSENNPKLLINKNQTPSEIDEQRGYGFILRGLICAIRNPLSHDKHIKYSKETTDSIIMFINDYILPKLEDTKEFGYVDNWFNFIFVDNDNDSEKYSNKLLDNLNKKDKTNLMKEIVEKISQIKEGKYSYFINELYNCLSTRSKNEIIVMLNRKLIKVGNDNYLRMFFNHFNPKIWKELDDLVTARIEDIAIHSISNGKIVFSPINMRDSLVKEASLSTWIPNWIEYFDNIEEIKKILFKKMYNKEEAKYVLKYFYKTVTDKEFLLYNSNEILEELRKKNYYFKELVEENMLFNNDPDLEIFKKDYEKIKDIKEPKNSDEELPF